MPRRIKTGLDFYYKDVHEWDQIPIVSLINKYGTDGYCVYTLTESRIYEMGYYLEIPLESLALYVMRILGLKDQNRVIAILNYCAKLGLFDPELLSKSVVTSISIQKHYLSVTARRKVDKSKYWLLDKITAGEEKQMEKIPPTKIIEAEKPISAAETGENATEMPENATEMQQSKVNKSKENKTKEKYSKVKQTIAKEREATVASIEASFISDEDAARYLAHFDRCSQKELEYLMTIPGEHPSPSDAYFLVTGNRMTNNDWDALDEMMFVLEADERLIESVILEVGERNDEDEIDIFSMRYFIPIVKEALDRKSGKAKAKGVKKKKDNRSGRYPDTSDTAEIERILDEEWAKEVSQYTVGEDYDYDDGQDNK